MKNYLASTIAATGLIIFIFGMDCAAQSVPRVTADIPFDFYVGGELLPKGTYEFEPASKQSYPTALIIRPRAKTARRAMIVPSMANAASQSKDGPAVVFNRYGSVHYLSTITTDAGGMAFRLLRTSAEKRLAREIEPAKPVMIQPMETAGR